MAFDNIKLEKGLYTTGKSFTAALEALDPSENYIGTELEGLDAYQRQLKRFDIKVSGSHSDNVAKFFKTTDSAALFPEFVARAVRQGMEQDNPLDKILATTTEVDSLDYRAISTDMDNSSIEPAHIAEGAAIPETVIRLKETLTPLTKRGRMLVASYEAVKFQKLDLFSLILAQIGNAIAKAQLIDAVNVILSSSDVPYITIGENDTGITYSSLLNLWESLGDYQLTTLMANSAQIKDILTLTEFRDAAAGLDFHGSGKLVTPFGAEIIRIGGYDLDSRVIGLDSRYTLEKVQAGGIQTDFDKLIDRQLERATVTAIAGFSLINVNAATILDTVIA